MGGLARKVQQESLAWHQGETFAIVKFTIYIYIQLEWFICVYIFTAFVSENMSIFVKTFQKHHAKPWVSLIAALFAVVQSHREETHPNLTSQSPGHSFADYSLAGTMVGPMGKFVTIHFSRSGPVGFQLLTSS